MESMHDVHLTFSPQKGTPGHCMVAQVWKDGKNLAEIVPTEDESEATQYARLFAAAPDLLTVCEEVSIYLGEEESALTEMVRKAIRKAGLWS